MNSKLAYLVLCLLSIISPIATTYFVHQRDEQGKQAIETMRSIYQMCGWSSWGFSLPTGETEGTFTCYKPEPKPADGIQITNSLTPGKAALIGVEYHFPDCPITHLRVRFDFATGVQFYCHV